MNPGKEAYQARLRFTQSPRAPHLFRLWQQLSSQAQLPQVDRWLAQYFRGEKRFGQKDRQWYSDAVFQALRLGIWAVAAERLLELEAKVWGGEHEALLLALTPPELNPAQCWSLVKELPAERLFFWLSLRDADPLLRESLAQSETALLQIWQAAVQAEPASLGLHLLWQGIPLFYAGELQLRCELSEWNSDNLQDFLQAQSRQAPLWIRVNPWAPLESSRQQLSDAGYSIEVQNDAWLLRLGKGLQKLEGFLQGWFEIQDLASQSIGRAVELKAGQLIWDCCAGGGGKTLQLAAQAGRGASIFASDVRAYKLEEVQRRAERGGLKNIYGLPWNGVSLPVLPKNVQKSGGFDCILIDAPCSATGTWRRSPDARYRVDAASLADLRKIQEGIFAVVLPALKPGGRLIYASCSWLPAENEVIIQAVLKKYPQLELRSMQLTGCPGQDSDTMFVAVLQSSR